MPGGRLRVIADKVVQSDVRIGAARFVLHAGAYGPLRGYLPEPGKAPRLARSAMLGLTLVLACAAVALLLPNSGDARAPEVATPQPALTPKPAWAPIIRPIRLFTLEAPELAQLAPNYEAIRSMIGDGREDHLSFGAAALTEAPFMRIAVYRAGSEASEPAPFATDLSRRTAAAGLLAAKVTPGETMHPKFGEMQTAELKLSTKGIERSCLGYRRAVASESLRITGWYCAPTGSFAGRASLSCLIDRLTLISAGEDTALRNGFVAAEQRRITCGKIPLLAASATMPSVADGKDPPRLRGIKLR
jgi:hypothetical protein